MGTTHRWWGPHYTVNSKTLLAHAPQPRARKRAQKQRAASYAVLFNGGHNLLALQSDTVRVCPAMNLWRKRKENTSPNLLEGSRCCRPQRRRRTTARKRCTRGTSFSLFQSLDYSTKGLIKGTRHRNQKVTVRYLAKRCRAGFLLSPTACNYRPKPSP